MDFLLHLQFRSQHLQDRIKAIQGWIAFGGQHPVQALAGPGGIQGQFLKADSGIKQITKNQPSSRGITV